MSTSKNLSGLIGSLGPDDESLRASSHAAALAAEQNWPLLKSVRARATTAPPPLSTSDKTSAWATPKSASDSSQPTQTAKSEFKGLAASLSAMARKKPSKAVGTQNEASHLIPERAHEDLALDSPLLLPPESASLPAVESDDPLDSLLNPDPVGEPVTQNAEMDALIPHLSPSASTDLVPGSSDPNNSMVALSAVEHRPPVPSEGQGMKQPDIQSEPQQMSPETPASTAEDGSIEEAPPASQPQTAVPLPRVPAPDPAFASTTRGVVPGLVRRSEPTRTDSLTSVFARLRTKSGKEKATAPSTQQRAGFLSRLGKR